MGVVGVDDDVAAAEEGPKRPLLLLLRGGWEKGGLEILDVRLGGVLGGLLLFWN